MADFGTNGIVLKANTGASDASPTFTTLNFGTAGYELRAALSTGSQTTSTSSSSWPSILKPASGQTLIDNMYLFTADTTGNKITTYDGTFAHYKQFQIAWDNTGTYASAPILSAWKDSTLPAASPGTQPGTGDGSSIVNGTTQSSSTSLLKATAFDQANTPGSNSGVTVTHTSGSAGSVSPGASAWTAAQSLQAATQFITCNTTPTATTASQIYFLLALYLESDMIGGTLLASLGWQYTWI